MKMTFKAISSLAVIAITMNACSYSPDSSGSEYMPDMYRSAAIEPYVDYGQVRERIDPEKAGRLSAMIPPFGAIPYFGTDSATVALNMPFPLLPNEAFKQTHGLINFAFTAEDTYAKAAEITANNLQLTKENADKVFAEGKKLYTANCIQCHGEKGDGNGTMVANGIYTGVPDYADKKELSNGQIFYSIYYGKGAMGSPAHIINKKEIWTLVHYIRKFQDSNYGPASVVAANTTPETPAEAEKK